MDSLQSSKVRIKIANQSIVRKKDTGKIYAMKIIQKEMIQKKEKIKQIMTERNILQMTQNDFVINLHWAFKSVILNR